MSLENNNYIVTRSGRRYCKDPDLEREEENKSKHKNNLFVKNLIPENSGHSVNTRIELRSVFSLLLNGLFALTMGSWLCNNNDCSLLNGSNGVLASVFFLFLALNPQKNNSNFYYYCYSLILGACSNNFINLFMIPENFKNSLWLSFLFVSYGCMWSVLRKSEYVPLKITL